MRRYLRLLAVAAATAMRSTALTAESLAVPGVADVQYDLCSLLEEVHAGERVPVIVSGILAIGYEHQVLYDPDRPLCNGAVQPSTWVEYAQQFPENKELNRLLERSRRALVVVRGELFGPARVGPDDPDLALNLAYANRVARRRHGESSSFRTKLVISEIIDTKPVPELSPSQVTYHRPRNAEELLAVKEAALAQYPQRPRQIGLEGDVVIGLTIEDGRVTETLVESGDRLLAEAAVSNVKTWRFESGLNARLFTRFSFQLADPLSQGPPVKVIAELPRRVILIAKADAW